MRRATVLAVDDTPANLVALQAVLQHDFDLVFAHSGAEALALLEKQPEVDVILLDLQMPVMDGFETARRIKAMPGCEDIPIVFITAVFSEDPFVKRGYEVGGVDYFSKPYDPELLRLKLSIYASFRQRAAILKERERQIAEAEALVSAEERLSTVLKTLPVGVLVYDSEGRLSQTNDEASRIFSATGPFGADHERLSRALLTGASSHDDLHQVRCLDGSMKTVLSSTSPLFGSDAKISGAVVVIQDVTEQRALGAELQSRISRLVSSGLEPTGNQPAAAS